MGRSDVCDVNSTMTCIFRGQIKEIKGRSRGPGLDGNEIDSVWPVGATKQSAPYKLSLTHRFPGRFGLTCNSNFVYVPEIAFNFGLTHR